MSQEELTLTLNPSGSGEEFSMTAIQSVDISSTKEAFSIAPPGLAASENILLGVSGMQADITVNWVIYDDGSDRANGTHTSTVTTVQEQITYLEDTIQDPSFSASWELNHETGTAFENDEVFLENVEMTPISFDNPKWKPARMRLRRGGSV